MRKIFLAIFLSSRLVLAEEDPFKVPDALAPMPDLPAAGQEHPAAAVAAEVPLPPKPAAPAVPGNEANSAQVGDPPKSKMSVLAPELDKSLVSQLQKLLVENAALKKGDRGEGDTLEGPRQEMVSFLREKYSGTTVGNFWDTLNSWRRQKRGP